MTLGRTVTEPARELPVRYEGYDVVVAGGGVAGVAAALAAAEEGSRVLLLERMFGLGGLATLGLIAIYLPLDDGMGRQVSFGLAERLLRLSIAHGHQGRYPDTWLQAGGKHGDQRFEVQYDPQVFAVLMEKALTEAGVRILYGTTVAGVLRRGNRVDGLIVENKSGRFAIPVRACVDATGDADVFHLAHAPTVLHAGGNPLAAWYYETWAGRYTLRMVGEADRRRDDAPAAPADAGTPGRISGVDAGEVSDMTLKSHLMSLEAFLKRGPVSESHGLSTLAAIPQLRMTRRICGARALDIADDHAHMADSVGMIGDWRRRGPVFEVPLGALYTQELNNVMAAGRIISVTDDMWDVTRVIPPCAVTGEAAGAALALTDDISRLDPACLQKVLRRRGVKLHLNGSD